MQMVCNLPILVSKLTIFRLPFWVLFLVVCTSSTSLGETIAVFPFLDLSQDDNGVNFTITENVRQKLIEDGYEILPENSVVEFMVRNRVRSLGTLSSYELTRLQKELGADYALLGTVCQIEEMPKAKLSMSMQLVRTSDEEIVWSTIKDLHKEDMITLLALNNPETFNDLYREYFSTLFETFMQDVQDQEGPVKPFVDLLFVDMRPLYVKPGEKIDLTVRLYSNVPDENMPKLYLEMSGKKIQVEMDEDMHFISTSFLAEETDGEHKVSLLAEFPSGEKQKLELDQYTVDSVPPQVSLDLIGKELDDGVYFSKDLHIMSKLLVPERLSMWDVTVFDEYDERVVKQGAEGRMPQKIIWSGLDDKLETIPDGKYKVVATVWDQAMNKAQAEQVVHFRKTKPEVAFYVTQNEDSVTIEIEDQIGYPMEFWFAKVYRENGQLVLQEVGERLPPALEFSVDGLGDKENLELIFAPRDIYGNSSYFSIPGILGAGTRATQSEIVPESQWLESF